MFSNLCRSTTCFKDREKKHEIEVPPFFPIQQTINQLPPFQQIYQQSDPRISLGSPKKKASRHCEDEGLRLKKIKSEPRGLIFTPGSNDKENVKESQSTQYGLTSLPSKQQTAPRPAIHILYNKPQNAFNSKTNHNLIQSQPHSQSIEQYSPPPFQYSNAFSQQPSSLLKQSQSSNMVSVEEFNRVVNINKSLIKMLENDFRVPRNPVEYLQEEQQERGRMIDHLEDRVRQLKVQMGSRRRQPPVSPFY